MKSMNFLTKRMNNCSGRKILIGKNNRNLNTTTSKGSAIGERTQFVRVDESKNFNNNITFVTKPTMRDLKSSTKSQGIRLPLWLLLSLASGFDDDGNLTRNMLDSTFN